MLVDTLGLLWLCRVTAAEVQDRNAARLRLEKTFQRGLSWLRLVWVDVALPYRRLSKDYRHHVSDGEAMIRVASTALMLRCLISHLA